MARGKKIELYLVNGTNDGPVIAELSNWNGQAIKISREDVKNCEELENVGVYLLFCYDEEQGVYIGESDNIKTRLQNHITAYNQNKEPYYWVKALCFVGRDLDKAKVRYLEHKLTIAAEEANRYKVLTKSTCPKVPLKQSTIDELDDFIDRVKLLTSALGINIFSSNETKSKEAEKSSNIYSLIIKEASGKMIITDEGFVVLAGSVVSNVISKSCPPNVVKKRKAMVENGIIDLNGVVTKDVVFKSPSASAAFIAGTAISGNAMWRDENGLSLKDKKINL